MPQPCSKATRTAERVFSAADGPSTFPRWARILQVRVTRWCPTASAVPTIQDTAGYWFGLKSVAATDRMPEGRTRHRPADTIPMGVVDAAGFKVVERRPIAWTAGASVRRPLARVWHMAGLIPNILIIGNDAAVRRYMQRSFVSHEYRYTYATSAEEAVTATRDVRMDAALLDMVGAGSPGLHLAAHLRQSVTNLPIVVVTPALDAALAFEALSLGATDCLLAPVSSSELHAAVERAIRWRRAAVLNGACDRLAREMSIRSAALARACAESGIGSSMALESWVATLYRHDEWAWRHVRRVADLSVVIAPLDDIPLPVRRRICSLHRGRHKTAPRDLPHQ